MKTAALPLMLGALGLGLPTSGFAKPVTLRSDLPAYEVAQPDGLPAAPAGREQDCRSAPPQQRASKAVQAAGWQVISEASLGGHAVVAFAADSSLGPEGVCEYTNSNLGIFAGEQLVGLYWSRGESSKLFGRLEAGPEGVVTINNSTFPVVPVGQLAYQNDGFVLQALPPSLAGCGGRVDVPQLWLSPIDDMRARLIETGWSPVVSPAAGSEAEFMQQHGFPETATCSGSAVNYCSLAYATAGAELRIITVGELGEHYRPMVADYELTCEGESQ